MKSRKQLLGLQIHIKIQFILINIRYYIIFVLYRLLHINYIEFPSRIRDFPGRIRGFAKNVLPRMPGRMLKRICTERMCHWMHAQTFGWANIGTRYRIVGTVRSTVHVPSDTLRTWKWSPTRGGKCYPRWILQINKEIGNERKPKNPTFDLWFAIILNLF